MGEAADGNEAADGPALDGHLTSYALCCCIPYKGNMGIIIVIMR